MAKAYHLHEEEKVSKPRNWWMTKAILGLATIIFLIVMVVGGVIAALRLYTGTAGVPIGNPNNVPTGTITVTLPPITPTPTPGASTIKVFFSRKPESESNFQLVYQVNRSVNSTNLPVSSMEALIAGPTRDESRDNLFTEWKLSGISNCVGQPFSLVISGTTATVRLCQDFNSAGVGQDARAQAQADTTLKQFSSIQRTIYLNKDGNCLFDQSGTNQCLQ